MSEEQGNPPEAGAEEEVGNDVDDSTIVVTHDETIVVADHDRTIAVPHDDRTVVVPARAASDETIVATSRSRSRTGRGGAPSADGAIEELPSGLARLFYKNPLDPKRRAPDSPFPRDRSALPRGGVRSGIPVVYGTRSEELVEHFEGTEFARWIGPPPEGYELPTADRGGLPSTARFNRRFRLLALAGGGGAIVVAVAGLWWIAGQLFYH